MQRVHLEIGGGIVHFLPHVACRKVDVVLQVQCVHLEVSGGVILGGERGIKGTKRKKEKKRKREDFWERDRRKERDKEREEVKRKGEMTPGGGGGGKERASPAKYCVVSVRVAYLAARFRAQGRQIPM